MLPPFCQKLRYSIIELRTWSPRSQSRTIATLIGIGLGRDAAIECYLADAYYRPILSTESHRSSPHIIRLRPVLVLCFEAPDQLPVGVPIAWRRSAIGETGSGASPY